MKFKYHIGQIEKDYKERDEERLKLATQLDDANEQFAQSKYDYKKLS